MKGNKKVNNISKKVDVSVIIGLYNGERFIRETIDSALRQRNIEVEIIVIDDGSSDDSIDKVRAICKYDNRVCLYRNERNTGFCRTVNRGLSLAKGEYVIILDQDDLLSENHCETLLKYFVDNTVVMVFTDHFLIDENGVIFDDNSHCRHKEIVAHDFVKGNCIPVPGLMLRRSTLIDIGGYPVSDEFPNYGEYHTWVRMCGRGRIVFCNEVRAYYRRHNNNMTNSFNNRDVQKKLVRYFWECRKELIKNRGLNYYDRMRCVFYSVKERFKLIF